MLRIIAGRAKGRMLEAPPDQKVRPTSGRVREALFSMLVSRLDTFAALRVLDPFAGSGALGLEAWSRGAAQVDFIEADPKVWRLLQANIQRLGASPHCTAHKGRSPGHLRNLHPPYHLVFLDPPYREDLLTLTLESLDHTRLLAPDAWILAEFASQLAPSIPKAFSVDVQRDYANTSVALLRLNHPT